MFFFDIVLKLINTVFYTVYYAPVAQTAEHNHGKVGVSSSILLGSLEKLRRILWQKKHRLNLLHFNAVNANEKITRLQKIEKIFKENLSL